MNDGTERWQHLFEKTLAMVRSRPLSILRRFALVVTARMANSHAFARWLELDLKHFSGKAAIYLADPAIQREYGEHAKLRNEVNPRETFGVNGLAEERSLLRGVTLD